jgi:hypothetical protein
MIYSFKLVDVFSWSHKISIEIVARPNQESVHARICEKVILKNKLYNKIYIK